MTITRFIFSDEEVQKQLKQNVLDLATTFSNYDLLSEEQRTEHICSIYKSKIVGIASHLDALAQCDKKFKDVKFIRGLYEDTDGFDDFDPRYASEYSTKWNEKPDTQAEINQKLLDLEKILEIEGSPESRFVLLNALKFSVKKDADN